MSSIILSVPTLSYLVCFVKPMFGVFLSKASDIDIVAHLYNYVTIYTYMNTYEINTYTYTIITNIDKPERNVLCDVDASFDDPYKQHKQ